MSGVNLTAAIFAFILGAILVSPSHADDKAPVVALKQPISVVGYSCSCNACDAGLPCGGRPVRSPLVPAILGACDAALGCGAAPSCGPADGTCDATPTCGLANEPTCGSGPTCGLDLDCNSAHTPASSLASLWSNRSLGSRKHGSCKKCKRRNIDCCCLNLCKQQGFWLRAEALMWWTPNESIPTLVSSSPLGTPIDDVGVLGLPSTTPLSSDSLFGDLRGGGRVRFGKWADCHGLGFESSGWIIGNDQDESVWQSDGDPALAIPFNNVDPLVPGPDSELAAFDGVLRGQVRLNSSSEIYGGDAGVRKNLYCASNPCNGSSYRVDGYAGYRYFRVREGLRLTENLESTSLVGPTVLGTTIDLYDDFQTRNEFHGGNVGMILMRQHRRWSSEIVTRVAFGNVDREVRINGQTTVTVPNLAPVIRPGGIFTQPTNIGVYKDSDFAILPEFQLNLGYAVTNHTKFMVGYTFLYLGDLVRPGDVIDTNINGNQLDASLPLAGPARPDFRWSDSEMWLMGLTLGAEVSF